MCYYLRFNKTNFKTFYYRLNDLNKYLPHFPVWTGRNSVTSLSNDKLVEIIDRAKPIKYQQVLLANNYDPYSKLLVEFPTYLEYLELSFKIQ